MRGASKGGGSGPRPTRFAGLGYRQDSPGNWRVVDLEGDASVGPSYRTKLELLADLPRFAAERGFA